MLRLLFVPLRLTGDSEVGEQDCMDDDLAEGRAGELIDYQADALPHRLDSTTPLHTKADQRGFCLLLATSGTMRGNHQATAFFL